MIRLQAHGNRARVDVCDHHLVISRPGGVSGTARNQIVPFSSIKSVAFYRPTFFRPGRIVLFVAGGQSRSLGTPADDNTVFFGKEHLSTFEQLLQIIEAAIATPSLEQLAMAAARRQSLGESVDRRPREPTPGQLQRIDLPLSEQALDAEFRASGEGLHGGRAPHQASAPPNSESGSFRKALGRAGTFVLIGVILLLLLTMLSGPGENVVAAPADPAIDGAEPANASAQDPSATSADQMLSQWAEFVSGQASTEGFGLTNGNGHVGEFCSASNGSWTMAFGGRRIGSLPLYDYFAALKAGTGFAGAFTFDPPTRELTGVRLIKQKQPDGPSRSTPDLHMSVSQVQPGIVVVNGTQMHLCVL